MRVRGGARFGARGRVTCSERELALLVASCRFLEHAAVHGNVYGTSWKAVDHVRKQGKMCVLDIDVKGCVSCRDRWTNAP